MGRWVWATLGGRDTETTVVTYYRPCDNNVDNAGESSAWTQQYNHITKTLIEQDATKEELDNVDPRDKLNRDLDNFIAKKKNTVTRSYY